MDTADRIDREMSAYARSSAENAHHLALLHLVRARALRGDAAQGSLVSIKPVVVLPRRPSPRAVPIAFLACFTDPAASYVLPLKIGLNRIGRDPDWGDHEEFPRGVRLMEGRQWLMVCRPPEALVVDDHSTNQSILLPREAGAPDPVPDPRRKPGEYSYTRIFGVSWPGRVDLDWAGDVVGALGEGDVLLTMYAAFVFGWFPSVRDSAEASAS